MFTTLRKLSRIATLALTLTAAASAQSLDGEVVRNPDDTVTYTVHVDGPPGGQTALFLSPFLLPNPLQIPGFFHSLHIDPLYMTSLGGVPLNPFGQGCWTLTVPHVTALNVPIYFQTINVDTQLNLAFSQNWLQLINTPEGD